LSNLFSPAVPAFPAARLEPGVAAPLPRAVAPAATPSVSTQRVSAPPSAPPPAQVQKLRNEIRRLELLVKKLQAELEAEHQYCAALEAHFKTTQEGG
jgi:hypothetical protein